jgi:hypothetical protein
MKPMKHLPIVKGSKFGDSSVLYRDSHNRDSERADLILSVPGASKSGIIRVHAIGRARVASGGKPEYLAYSLDKNENGYYETIQFIPLEYIKKYTRVPKKAKKRRFKILKEVYSLDELVENDEVIIQNDNEIPFSNFTVYGRVESAGDSSITVRDYVSLPVVLETHPFSANMLLRFFKQFPKKKSFTCPVQLNLVPDEKDSKQGLESVYVHKFHKYEI